MPVEATDNEIRIRVESPGRFQTDSFRRIALSASRGIYAIVGRPKGSEKTRVQSLRFLKDKGWDTKKAREWAIRHNYKPKSFDDEEDYKAFIEYESDFEEEMWKEWDEEAEMEPEEVKFTLLGKFKVVDEKGGHGPPRGSPRPGHGPEEIDPEEDPRHTGHRRSDGYFRIRGHANVAADEKGQPYVDRDREIVEWQALADAINDYMSNPILRHMHKIPVGVVEEAEMDERGLVIEARIGQNYKEIVQDIEDGIYSSFSIGFRAQKITEYCVAEGECYRAFTKIELLEVSIVDIPANALSRFSPTKVYITGVDYTPSELVGKYVPLRGVKYLKWAAAEQVKEGDEPSEPSAIAPNSPIIQSITLFPDALTCGYEGEKSEKNTEGANMDEDETNPELAKALKELKESEERLAVYAEKERLEAEEKAFAKRVQAAVEAQLEGKIPENVMTEEKVKTMFEEHLAAQNGQRQSFAGGAPPAEKAITNRDEAFEYLGSKYFSRVKQPGAPEYTRGDIEFELWLENQCNTHGKIKHSDEIVHSVQKGGGITDPRFREAYDSIMKRNPDDYSSSATPFGGAAAASGLTFMPEGWADEIIELVYEMSFFRQMVDSMIMNEYKVHIPKLTGTMDYYQWTRTATEGGSDVTASAPTSDEVVLEMQTLLGSVPIGNAVIAYGVAGLGPGIKREMAKRLNWVELHSFVNGDLTVTTSYADNINGAWHTTDNPTGVDATHNTYKLMYNGMREHNFDAVTAGEVTNVDASGATISNVHIRNALKNLGVYGDNKTDLVLLIPKAVEATILGWTELLTIEKYGPAATIVTGEIGKLFGVTVVSSSVMREDLDSSGVRPATADVLTACLLFDKSSPIVGNPGPASRKFSITFDDEPKRDRFSLIPREDVAFNVRRRDSIVQIYNLATTVV